MGELANPEDYKPKFRITVVIEGLNECEGIRSETVQEMPYFGAKWIVPKDKRKAMEIEAMKAAVYVMRDVLSMTHEADLG